MALLNRHGHILPGLPREHDDTDTLLLPHLVGLGLVGPRLVKLGKDGHQPTILSYSKSRISWVTSIPRRRALTLALRQALHRLP